MRPLARELPTPEGVPLRVEIAGAGDRAYAFVMDSLIGLVAAALLSLPLIWAWSADSSGFILAILVLLFFALRNLYFPVFELRWGGQTPGKRMAKIRVADARGGPLTAEAVLVRNLTRDLEVYLPLTVLVAPRAVWPDAPPWAQLVSAVWACLFALLPFFNRNRLRIGDLLAGTVVLRAPAIALLDDMGDLRSAREHFEFSDAQLDVYAIYELQVLEGVLRRGAGDANRDALRLVADRVQAKIGWSGNADPYWFLRDFYAALRARLEHRMHLGQRRERR